MKSVGIDLAGKEENPTGVTVLDGKNLKSQVFHRDEEIIEPCRKSSPDIVAIDAPLSFPDEGGLRPADAELVDRGYRVLPPELGGMKYLTERGISLAEKLSDSGLEVIEVHPLTSGRILFDSKERSDWIRELESRGWRVDGNMNEHEIDSIMAAITGLLYLEGRVEGVGEEGEEVFIPQSRI